MPLSTGTRRELVGGAHPGPRRPGLELPGSAPVDFDGARTKSRVVFEVALERVGQRRAGLAGRARLELEPALGDRARLPDRPVAARLGGRAGQRVPRSVLQRHSTSPTFGTVTLVRARSSAANSRGNNASARGVNRPRGDRFHDFRSPGSDRRGKKRAQGPYRGLPPIHTPPNNPPPAVRALH